MSDQKISHELMERLSRLERKAATEPSSLQTGGGGGTFDGMEARVKALEGIAQDTRGTLESIQRQLARIDSKLDSKPDQGWVVNMIAVIFGLVLAAVAAAAGIFAFIK